MRLTILFISLLFSPVSFTAVVLPPSIPSHHALRPRRPLSNPTNIIINTTSPPPNILRIQCTAEYGPTINPGSCRNIFNYIGKSDEENILAQRKTGHPNAIPLPLRFVSDDGLCFVQPLLKVGAETARASSRQMGEAAYTLLQRCVVEKGLGGFATDIGGDNNLNVVIGENAPHVRCDKSPAKGPPWESCLLILSDMAASANREVFGVKGQDPRVEVNLPYFLKAIDARCQLEIGITGKPTSATWYQIWEAASALSAMCVRANEKGGKAYGIGLRRNMFIRISDENPDSRAPAANVSSSSGSAAWLGFEAPEDFR